MDFFNKAKEAAEKYKVKEKAVEYAQKQVAKREEEQCRSNYVEKKDKTIVNKAVEAAEDFLAKQGQPNGSSPANCEGRSRSSSSSSSSSSDDDKCRQKTIKSSTYSSRVKVNGYSESTETVVVTEKKFTSSNDDRDCNSSYPSRSDEDRSFVSSETVSRSENYSIDDSSSGRCESYQEYWSERGNDESEKRYTGGSQFGSDNVSSTSYSSRVEDVTGYGSDAFRQDTSTPYSARVDGNNGYGSNIRRDKVDAFYSSRTNNASGYSESTATVKKSSYSDDSSRDFNPSSSSREDETCSSFSRMALGNDGSSSGLHHRSSGPCREPAERCPRYTGNSQYDSDNFSRNVAASSYTSRVEDDNCYGSDRTRQSSTNKSTSYSSRVKSSNNYSESSSTVEEHTSSYTGESNSSYPSMTSESDRYGARREGYPSNPQYQSSEEFSSRSVGDYSTGEHKYSSYQSSERRSSGDEFNSGRSYHHQRLEEYSSHSDVDNCNDGRGYSGGANQGRTGYDSESSGWRIQESGNYPTGVGMPYGSSGSPTISYNGYAAPSASMTTNRNNAYPNDRV